MSEFCSICGNIHKNRTFKGGVICCDCLAVIRSLNLSAEPLLQDAPYISGTASMAADYGTGYRQRSRSFT